MKKLTLFSFVLIFLLLFTACTVNDNASIDQSPVQELPTLSPSDTTEQSDNGRDEVRHSNQPEESETEYNHIFSLIWMTDTQYYSDRYPEIFLSMSRWIVESKSQDNIQYVLHTGDVVNNCREAQHWENATEATKIIMEELPLYVIAGNHDIGRSSPSYDEYAKRYGPEVFQELPSLGGFYDGGMGRYDLFEYGAHRFIIAGLGYMHTQEAIDWLNSILGEHSDRIAILCFHKYLDLNGSLTDSGERLFNDVIKNNQNVQLVLSGHRHGSARRTTELEDGGDGITNRRIVQAILGNYQAYEKGGSGYLRIIKFDTLSNTVSVTAYSPYLDSFRMDDQETFSFSFSFN